MTPKPNTTWRPPYAYLPGRTPRHPETLFDRFKSDIQNLPSHRLNESQAWHLGVALMRDGFYWEAHELLEAVWVACAPNSAEKLYCQSVIQRANAALKQKLGQGQAADRILQKADFLERESRVRFSGKIVWPEVG